MFPWNSGGHSQDHILSAKETVIWVNVLLFVDGILSCAQFVCTLFWLVLYVQYMWWAHTISPLYSCNSHCRFIWQNYLPIYHHVAATRMDSFAINLELLCSKQKISEEQGRVSVGFNCFRLWQATVIVPLFLNDAVATAFRLTGLGLSSSKVDSSSDRIGSECCINFCFYFH
jgi:hypothetical protein